MPAKLFIIFSIPTFVILVFSMFIYRINEYDESACDGITEIATNSEKIDYLKKWSTEKLRDQDFITLIGWKSEIRLSDRPELTDEVGIDWEYLGLNKDYASVKFNRFIKDRVNYLETSTIKSIGFWQGRRLSIFLVLDNAGELGIDWSSYSLRKIIKINEKVSVFCGN